jgi:DNA adenine methylase
MKPLISYYGGKQRLAKWIISHFPQHRSYIEPFCGGAAVFFAKEPVQLNVLNDTNGAVVNLYRQAKLQPDALFRLIDATPHSRAEYKRAEDIYKGKTEADELVQAWAMYTATMQAFGSKTASGWAFAISDHENHKAPHHRLRRHKDRLPDILDLLSSIQIECKDALDCILQYDHPDALFYIDPPYIGTEQGHYAGYTQQDFNRLLEALTTIKGTFFLSHYATAMIESFALKSDWISKRKKMDCALAQGRNSNGDNNARIELLVTNHKPQALFP